MHHAERASTAIPFPRVVVPRAPSPSPVPPIYFTDVGRIVVVRDIVRRIPPIVVFVVVVVVPRPHIRQYAVVEVRLDAIRRQERRYEDVVAIGYNRLTARAAVVVVHVLYRSPYVRQVRHRRRRASEIVDRRVAFPHAAIHEVRYAFVPPRGTDRTDHVE